MADETATSVAEQVRKAVHQWLAIGVLVIGIIGAIVAREINLANRFATIENNHDKLVTKLATDKIEADLRLEAYKEQVRSSFEKLETKLQPVDQKLLQLLNAKLREAEAVTAEAAGNGGKK